MTAAATGICPSRSPETKSPCALLDREDAHDGVHASARAGSRALWQFTCADYARWRPDSHEPCVWKDPAGCSVHGDGSNGADSLSAMQNQGRLADACPLCGPGYRYGDDGCQHSPAPASPGTPEADGTDLRARIAAAVRDLTYAGARLTPGHINALVPYIMRPVDAALATREAEVRRWMASSDEMANHWSVAQAEVRQAWKDGYRTASELHGATPNAGAEEIVRQMSERVEGMAQMVRDAEREVRQLRDQLDPGRTERPRRT